MNKRILTLFIFAVEALLVGANAQTQNPMDFLYDNLGLDAAQEYFKSGYAKLERKEYAGAVRDLLKAHEKGNINATYLLGECIFAGLGTDKDEKNAFAYLQSAATKGQVDACYTIGVLYCNGFDSGNLHINVDTERGMEWLRIAAEKGHSNAQWMLGDLIYINGDYATAFVWYEKSAKQNNSIGVKRMGTRLMDGDGVSQDLDKAIECLLRAKSMGEDVDIVLGKAYYKSKDYKTAIKYFSILTDDKEAIRWLGSCYSSMRPADYNLAVKYWEIAAAKGELLATFYTALCYYDGLGCDKNYAKAVELFSKILPLNEEISFDEEYGFIYGISAKFLGNCYRYGRGTQQNLQISQNYYDVAKQCGGYDDVTVREIIDNITQDK